MADISRRLAESFYHHKQKLGLTFSQIANACGVAEVTLRKWTEGKANPTLRHLCAVAGYMGLSLDELAGLKGGVSNGR